MTTEEVAEALGVPERTVQYWLKSGWLKGRNVKGRVWLVSPAEVEAVRSKGRPRRGPPKRTPTAAPGPEGGTP